MNQELKFCDLEGAQTPVGFNGFMRLGDSDYVDHRGALHTEPAPEGYLKADHICWNGTLGDVQRLVSELTPGKRYNVLIHERGSK